MAFLATIVAALALAAPASAADSCPDRVVADWNANLALDGTYAPSCLERTLGMTRDAGPSGLVDAIEERLRGSVRAAPSTARENDSLPGWLVPTIAFAALTAVALVLRRP